MNLSERTGSFIESFLAEKDDEKALEMFNGMIASENGYYMAQKVAMNAEFRKKVAKLHAQLLMGKKID